jgi:uncharacterized protein (TIGR03437 family)
MRKISAAAVLAITAMAFAPAPAQGQNLSYTYSYNGPPLPIFRDSANIISVANIFVPRSILVTQVTANIDIDYPNPGDMNIFMYSPILTRTKLLERNCGGQGTLTNITFDDTAANRYSDVCPVTGGSYRGNEPLSNFNNQNALGTWSLAVENNGSDSLIGYLRGFTIVFNGTAQNFKPITSPQSVFNAASFQSAVVAPGEMLTIAGANLGPSASVTAPAGNLPTSLGGVQVTFDGVPAGLSYVSTNILSVQAPVGLTQGVKTDMRVINQATSSDSVLIDVAAAVPGIYTQSANGRGQVTAVNADGTINSQFRPATKGTYVAIYAVGLGAVSPALATGQVPPNNPLSYTSSPVYASIDGYPATVTFAGAAPQLVGVYQINVLIPTQAGSGPRSLSVNVGGSGSSQNFVVIYLQ